MPGPGPASSGSEQGGGGEALRKVIDASVRVLRKEFAAFARQRAARELADNEVRQVAVSGSGPGVGTHAAGAAFSPVLPSLLRNNAQATC